MEPILISCAGMDVHEKKVDVCIAHGPLDKPPIFEIRTFPTMTSDLEVLKLWLKKYEVTTIAMESTGVYWKPIFNIMEDEFDVVLANPQHIKALRMNKTDIKDCKRIANLLSTDWFRGVLYRQERSESYATLTALVESLLEPWHQRRIESSRY
jgi:transposase